MTGHAAGTAQKSQVSARTYALLTDGSTVEIRPAHPGDAEDVRAMHAAMSPDNLYLRFFSLSPLNAEREGEGVCRQPGVPVTEARLGRRARPEYAWRPFG